MNDEQAAVWADVGRRLQTPGERDQVVKWIIKLMLWAFLAGLVVGAALMAVLL